MRPCTVETALGTANSFHRGPLVVVLTIALDSDALGLPLIKLGVVTLNLVYHYKYYGGRLFRVFYTIGQCA